MNLKKIFIFGLLSTCITPASIFAEWQTQTIDSPGYVGTYSSIVVDSSGNPHIAYLDYTNKTIKYAVWTSSSWTIQTVESMGAVVSAPMMSIALNSYGAPYISYDNGNGVLKCAKWTGTAWTTETVATGWTIFFNSIAIDTSGNPHISYYDYYNSTTAFLKYAKWNGSSWVIETVDSNGNIGQFNSIKLDSSNNPHISYYDWTNGNLKYSKWTGTAWATQTADSAGEVGRYASLALDSQGNPHISYLDGTNTGLKYAKWTGSAWVTQYIEAAGDVGYFTSIALDNFGNPLISYYESTSGFNLKYAKWTGFSWQIQMLDTNGDVGYGSSMALDALGNPHISYYDSTNKDLKYIKWNTAPVLSWTGDTGYETDGSNPDNGASGAAFGFKIKYSDISDSPASGFPKLYILRGGTTVQTLLLNYVSGTNYSGAIYSTSTILSGQGSDYFYHFVAYDIWSSTATGSPTDLTNVLTVGVPTLNWTEEAGYITIGVSPVSGDLNSFFTYRVKYIDPDNDAPAIGYPKTHITKGGAEISGSPFSMTFVNGAYNTGAIYTYARSLPIGNDYAYYFEAQDANANPATGEPAISLDSPDVSEIAQGSNKTTLGDNLFNPRAGGTTKIKFNIPAAGHVSLIIYSLSGRLIRTLFEGESGSGDMQRDWDGKDDSGRYVIPGVYFLQYVYPGGKEVRKIGVKR